MSDNEKKDLWLKSELFDFSCRCSWRLSRLLAVIDYFKAAARLTKEETEDQDAYVSEYIIDELLPRIEDIVSSCKEHLESLA